jgi:predicted nucleic acid-binding protein
MPSGKHQQHKAILLDASSAILLAKAGFHEILAVTYSILMSDSVFDEITRKGLPGSSEYRQLLQEERLQVLPVLNPSAIDTPLQKLDRGERDTLLLFHEGHGDFVVTDDGAAARFCLGNRVPFVNSLLLLRLLHHSTIIKNSSYETGFQSLLALGRYSEKVKKYARSCPDSELLFFLP